MKARYLTFLASVVITVGMTSSLLFVARRIVLAEFLAAENRHLKEDIHRAVSNLDSELQNLDHTARDYANWDDTYQFMHDHLARYLHSNYTPVSFANLGLRTVILLDTSGRIVYTASWRRDGNGTERDADVRQVKQAAMLAQQAGGMAGVIPLTDGPVLASVRPILKTNETGVPRGTLIMLRDLDYRLLAKISTLAVFPLGLYRKELKPGAMQSDLHMGVRSTGDVRIRLVDDEQVAVAADLFDCFGNPSYELEIRHGREIWQQGLHAYRFLMYSIVLFGCVFGGMALLLVHLVYVRRVEVLTRFAEQIKNEHGLKSRINFRWKDELAHLADQINQMLEDLHHSHQKLALARERLQHEATHDSLTGAWNCAAALELLDREIARGEREGSNVAVFMLDIDYFKGVNDRFGHAAGDRALQAIAASLGRVLRNTDILARYGGEEFLVIAPNCNLSEARRLAERILLRTEATPIEVGDGKATVTVSIGVVAGGFPLSAEELIALADRALYRAKENGRNRAEYEDAIPARVKGTLYCMPRRTV